MNKHGERHACICIRTETEKGMQAQTFWFKNTQKLSQTDWLRGMVQSNCQADKWTERQWF